MVSGPTYHAKVRTKDFSKPHVTLVVNFDSIQLGVGAVVRVRVSTGGIKKLS